MKRELLQNVKIQPYTSGDALDREGFLSAVIGAKIGTTGALTVTVTHSDDNSTFTAVTDTLVFPDKPTTQGHDGEYTLSSVTANDIVNIDVDLVGLKKYVKITASGAAATSTTLAIVLGDAANQSV